MKQPLWQRRRRIQENSRRPGEDVVADDPPPPPAEGSAVAEVVAATGSAASPPPAPDREAAYAAWAQRMRSHKKDKLADIATARAQEEEQPATSPYWDVSNLYADPATAQPDDPTTMETSQLLSLLGVDADVSPEALQVAYRRLVKEHHPDRWIDAPAEVRDRHADRMALISEAHRELRRRLA